MQRIPVAGGEFALVDDRDYRWLVSHKWHALAGPQTVYARTSVWQPDEGKIRNFLMHRLILELTPNDPRVDHIDGNGLNNQRSNLRLATRSQNGANTHSVRAQSGYKGVYENRPDRFTARITVERKQLNLGTFGTPELAAEAYNRAAIEHFGQFARLNVIRERK